MSASPSIARWCSGALLVTPDGRYLMQLRDSRPDILLPGHWALFGGTIDAGETAEAAMRRELAEELEFHPREMTAFSEMVIELPFAPPRFDRMSFFAVPIMLADEAAMVQHEGAGRRLFTPEALAMEARVAPWDMAVVFMHSRQASLFRR